jgi:hypothetical protein
VFPQPGHENAGIAVVVILDDVVGRSKTLREAHITHVNLKRLVVLV